MFIGAGVAAIVMAGLVIFLAWALNGDKPSL